MNAWFIDQTTGKVTAAFTAGLDLKANSLENVSKILSANGKWSIDESGKLVVKEATIEKLKAQSATFGSSEKPEGITIYDEDTGEPYCIKIKGGESITLAGKCEELDSTQ